MIAHIKKHFAAMAVFLALLLLFSFLLGAGISRIKSYGLLREKYHSDKELLVKYTLLRQNAKGLKQLMDKLNKRALRASEGISVFEMFNTEAGKSNVVIVSFSPENTSGKYLGASLLIRGRYRDILKFFESIEKSGYFLNIAGFEIYNADSQKALNEAKLSVQVSMER